MRLVEGDSVKKTYIIKAAGPVDHFSTTRQQVEQVMKFSVRHVEANTEVRFNVAPEHLDDAVMAMALSLLG